MKLLMIYCDRFTYRTSQKALDTAPEIDATETSANVLVGFIHVEQKDENDPGYVETKLVKNLKWAARKNNTIDIILHSFAHLADTKASPEITATIFNQAQTRLESAEYKVRQTPFGYFLDLELKAPGNPLTRLFKEF